ncbi:MAG: hypothetical protein WBE68_23810, partial [Candidatus Nitrosopolaris sp.]
IHLENQFRNEGSFSRITDKQSCKVRLDRLSRSCELLRSKGNAKRCLSCGNVSTREALFDLDGELTLIQRYCDICMIKLN